MLYLLLFLLELILLFFLSKRVQRKIGSALLAVTKSKRISVYLMALLFFPGTFVHEIAHFLAALFLLVPVGNLELLPKIDGDVIKLGSVGIGKTDPIRRFIIGAAPFFTGTFVILIIVYFTLDYFLGVTGAYSISQIFGILFIVYLIFTVTNTMFSSKKDMEGMWGFVAIVAVVAGLLWVFNITIDWNFLINTNTEKFLTTASMFLLAPLLLDIIALIALYRK